MSRGARVLSAYWLIPANAAVLVFLALPLLAPLLLAAGAADQASQIYGLYGYVCHQWPFRSFFLLGPQATYSFESLATTLGHGHVYSFIGSSELGYKVAFCQRDLGIYAAILVGGLGYWRWRERVQPLSFRGYALLCLPIALDGFTQLFGWRESTWELRLLTGAIFGLATVWLIYPRVDQVLAGRGLNHAVSAPYSGGDPIGRAYYAEQPHRSR